MLAGSAVRFRLDRRPANKLVKPRSMLTFAPGYSQQAKAPGALTAAFHICVGLIATSLTLVNIRRLWLGGKLVAYPADAATRENPWKKEQVFESLERRKCERTVDPSSSATVRWGECRPFVLSNLQEKHCF